MAGPIGRLYLVDALADHHVEVFAHELLDHARRARRIIGRIAIDQHIDIGVDVGEHAPHHIALALAAFAAHLGAGRPRDLDGAVGRIVVVDIDLRRGQRAREIGDDGRTAASSLKHGMSTAIRIDDDVIEAYLWAINGWAWLAALSRKAPDQYRIPAAGNQFIDGGPLCLASFTEHKFVAVGVVRLRAFTAAGALNAGCKCIDIAPSGWFGE